VQARRATQGLIDAQKELEVARSRAEAATRSAESLEDTLSQKVVKLEAEVARLQDALSSAQQRASAAEAKEELLHEAVRKAEERAARLEMERSSRAAPAAGLAVDGATEGSHEAELAAEVKLLREELGSAQEQAAAATGHAKQFELLAQTSEEALRSVQVYTTHWFCGASASEWRSMQLHPSAFFQSFDSAFSPALFAG
jgi:hypothetical protein